MWPLAGQSEQERAGSSELDKREQEKAGGHGLDKGGEDG